jgi:hypothetical protein
VQNESQGKFQNISQALRQIFQNGRASLYKGFKWNLFGSAVKGSHGWMINNFANRIVENVMPQLPEDRSLTFPFAVGVITATIEGTLIITPLERMKTIEMTSNLLKHNGVIASIRQIHQEKGVKFFFTGLSSVVLRQITSWSSYLVFYDLYKSQIECLKKDETIAQTDKIFVAGLTGTSACFITAPVDFYKTQKQMVDSLPRDNTTLKNVLHLISKYGVKAFYSGFSSKAIRSSLSSIVIFSILDSTGSLPARMRIT